MNKKRNVGILIFDNAEVLGFAGPFEVFSVTSELNNFELFDVFTVGEKSTPIGAVNGLSVNPRYNFNNCPRIDVLIIAGGSGTRKLMKNKKVLDWIDKVHQKTELTISICSGARLLGLLGLLDDKPYCTDHEVYEHMKEIVPTGKPQQKQRFIIDVLIIAGGSGTRKLMKNKKVLDWIDKVHQKTELTISICSGARLLGLLGLLDDKPYCTDHEVYEHMKEIVPTGKPQQKQRFIKAGRIYSSGGIDLSFHIVEKLLGEKTTKQTATYMEYNRVK